MKIPRKKVDKFTRIINLSGFVVVFSQQNVREESNWQSHMGMMRCVCIVVLLLIQGNERKGIDATINDNFA